MISRVHESALIAKLTAMVRIHRKKEAPDEETIAVLERTIAQLKRQLRTRPQTRQGEYRRRHA